MPHLSRLRRRGRALPWVLVALLSVFAALLVYEKFFADRPQFTPDVDLLAELASAALVEEDTFPSGPLDWPQWRGPRRDGVTHEPDLLVQWPAGGPRPLWHAPGGKGFSSVAVAGGRAVTLLQEGAQEVVICWDAKTGKQRWRFAYECPFRNDYPGPRATPTLDGDRVYTVGATGLLHCLDATTGKLAWKHDLLQEFAAPVQEWGVACSPLIDGHLVFVNPGGPGGNSLAAFDKESGELAWKSQDDPRGYSSPIAVTVAGVRQIVFFTGDHVVGVSPLTGEPLWRYPWQTRWNVNAATPLAFQARAGDRLLDYVFIASGYRKGCALLKISADGPDRFRAEPVYSGNQLCCHFASPVRYRDHLYAIDETRELTCLDLRTGAVKWRQRGFHKGSLLRVDDRLLVLGEDGRLVLVEPDPTGYRAAARAQPLTGRCWTMPTLADGRLYLRNEDEVLCLEMKVTR